MQVRRKASRKRVKAARQKRLPKQVKRVDQPARPSSGEPIPTKTVTTHVGPQLDIQF